jgi:multiple sugar transport system ATP-binding protein
MASVRFEHVFKRFGDVNAVSDLNVEVADREFLVFVGPSGCGKTTSLRMLAGLEEISDGNIYIGDRVVNDVPPKDRDIAMVFQSYALYPHMSVYDNMAFGLKLRKMPKAEIDQRVRDAARRMGIEHLLDRKPKQLSGGQRQRVAVCRAIVRNPAVFLMDEPLSNLDAKLRVQARAEISKLHQQLGTTFIYVTHDQTEALTMGTRIVVMKDGFVQQVDSPLSLYDKPLNMFVAGFLGTPQINFFNSMLSEKNGDLWLTFNNTSIKLPADKASNPVVREYIGKEVVMAVRPEAIRDDEAHIALSPDTKVTASVEVVEMLGSETLLYLTIDGVSAIARVNPRCTAAVGDVVPMCFEATRIQLYDKDTEKVIVN